MLQLEKLRDLTLESAQEGRPHHLSAGSGLVRRGDYIYVIGDDERDLGVFSLTSGRPGQLIPLFEGELPASARERAQAKPDLEALTVMPPFRFNPDGALLAFGSGSGKSRDRGFVWSLDDDGSLRGFPRPIDLAPLYSFLEQHVAGEMNVEGLAVAGERVALFQRGNSEGGRSQVFYLSREEVIDTLTEDFAIEPSELEEVHDHDLGEADGIELHFTDADALPDGRYVFSATAEPDDDADGRSTAGSAVGIIGTDGSVERLELVSPTSAKIEGVDAVLADELIHLLLVCDADDVEVPSPLYSLTLPA